MMNLMLYTVTIAIWGTTWLAIKLQLGVVEIEASILYRFVLAAGVLFIVLALSRRLQPLGWRDHGYCLLQGACLFCFNFYCFYQATGYLSSGVVSVIFSSAAVFNAFNHWLFFGNKPSARVICGALVGMSGIVVLFWTDLARGHFNAETVTGFALGVLGTLFFSLGNMISVRHQRLGLRPPSTNAWGIFYGVVIMGLLAWVKGVNFGFSASISYIGSLLYLAIPGTVIAFTTYLLLVGRIGPERAAYATVLFPVVALSLSTVYEGYQWSLTAVFGVALVLAGNLVIFWQSPGKPGRMRMGLRPIA